MISSCPGVVLTPSLLECPCPLPQCAGNFIPSTEDLMMKRQARGEMCRTLNETAEKSFKSCLAFLFLYVEG